MNNNSNLFKRLKKSKFFFNYNKLLFLSFFAKTKCRANLKHILIDKATARKIIQFLLIIATGYYKSQEKKHFLYRQSHDHDFIIFLCRIRPQDSQ